VAPFTPARSFSEPLQDKLRATPNYNQQHAIRPITQELYEELVAASPDEPICLLGTWREASGDVDRIREAIATRGGWASWWSFVFPTELISQTPLWLYANEGGGRFRVRFRVSEVATSRGNDGIASPWPEITDEERRNITRTGDRQSEVCKTWLRITEVDRLNEELTRDDFEPVAPWSTEQSLLNQNAFGFARRRTNPSPTNVAARPYSVKDALEKLFISPELLTKIIAGLERKRNVILQGRQGSERHSRLVRSRMH